MGKPGLSGNYTHFKYLRENFPYYRFHLLSLGDGGIKEIDDSDYLSLGDHLNTKRHQKELARLLLDFCEKEQVNIIIPMNSGLVASCIPFLKNSKVIQIVNTDTPRVYQFITTHLNYTSKIICISQRQQDVLRRRIPKDIFGEKTILIPHAVRSQPYHQPERHQSSLTIGLLGRIHHGHKGVFRIPAILARISIPYYFEIVGDGPDKERFVKDLERRNIPFTLHGFVPQDKIHEFINKWDVLLFPSQVEGFPLTLIEAMNNGVVPLANHLPGITDFIITSGKDGFVIKKNNIKEFVTRIEQLNEDRDLLYRMKSAARDTVRQRFDLPAVIQQYQNVFDEVLNTKKPGRTRDFTEWQPYVEYKPSILNRIGFRLKKLLIQN